MNENLKEKLTKEYVITSNENGKITITGEVAESIWRDWEFIMTKQHLLSLPEISTDQDLLEDIDSLVEFFIVEKENFIESNMETLLRLAIGEMNYQEEDEEEEEEDEEDFSMILNGMGGDLDAV